MDADTMEVVIMSKTGSISTFILGGLVGAALGVLFAPRPGYETREILAERALDYWDNRDELYDAASGRAVELYATSRDVAVDATEQVRAKIDAARIRLKEEIEAVSAAAFKTEKEAADKVAELDEKAEALSKDAAAQVANLEKKTAEYEKAVAAKTAELEKKVAEKAKELEKAKAAKKADGVDVVVVEETSAN
jgi:gas vesicle protein